MPALKRRKVTTATPKNIPSSTRGITAFTKVSKSQVQAISKSLSDKFDCLTPAQLLSKLGPDRKRKLQVEEIKVDGAADTASAILSATISNPQRDIKFLPQRRLNNQGKIPQTPRKPTINSSTSTPADTPTKGTRALLDGLLLSSSPRKSQSSPLTSQNSAIIETYSSSYESVVEDPSAECCNERLPAELLDLINLHASFLTALSIHHAHNGTHTPADLRLLCPDVARAWGKRKVMLNDIQRTLGVLNSDRTEDSAAFNSPLAQLGLSNYGHGKICIEVKSEPGRSATALRPLDENRLNDAFAKNLRRLWEAKTKNTEAAVSTFVKNLPVEPIVICSSLSKMSPLLAKGQRRLEDLRAGIILKKQAEKEKAASVLVMDEKGRKPSLLERLKAKELRQSTLPAPPSKAEVGRRAALQRLNEVVAVLTLLTTSTSIGQQRISFTMPTILGKLRDSFKTPMSKEEGETCVRLLASDVAPEWLRVVKIGKFDAIVVNRDNRPSDLDIQERVRRAT